MASEPVECQVLVLRVSIHCEGCKKKVKKVLLHLDGVYRCDIDARSNKVMVTACRMLDAGVLVARLRKSGKLAEPWPEAPKPPHEPAAAKNQTDDPGKPNEEAAENPAPENAAAELEPEKSAADEAPKPPGQDEAAANGSTDDETKAATTEQQQPDDEANEKTSQQQQQQQCEDHQEKKPIDATVTVEFDRGYSRYHEMPSMMTPAHVMSYNVARPMASASYYAAAPTPIAAAPMPPASMAPRSQRYYIDEYAPPPSYYSRAAPSSHEPYSYPPAYHHHSQRSPADDYDYGYYYAAPPAQRSAFSPPREDMFNDENANSCSVM